MIVRSVPLSLTHPAELCKHVRDIVSICNGCSLYPASSGRALACPCAVLRPPLRFALSACSTDLAARTAQPTRASGHGTRQLRRPDPCARRHHSRRDLTVGSSRRRDNPSPSPSLAASSHAYRSRCSSSTDECGPAAESNVRKFDSRATTTSARHRPVLVPVTILDVTRRDGARHQEWAAEQGLRCPEEDGTRVRASP